MIRYASCTYKISIHPFMPPTLKHVETTSYSLDRLECPNLPFPMHQHKSHLTKYNGANSGLKSTDSSHAYPDTHKYDISQNGNKQIIGNEKDHIN